MLAKEIADKGITLVKDTQNLLPLNPEKHKEIYLIVIGDEPGYHNPKGDYAKLFISELENRGFHVTVYDAEDGIHQDIYAMEIEELKKKYDVVCYFCNVETRDADSAARITWPGGRYSVPRRVRDLPHMMVSVDNPYHLIDAPRVPTYINAYTSEDVVVKTLVSKICGESEFKGISPINAFVHYDAFDTFNADK